MTVAGLLPLFASWACLGAWKSGHGHPASPDRSLVALVLAHHEFGTTPVPYVLPAAGRRMNYLTLLHANLSLLD